MDLQGSPDSNDVFFANFNQDCTALSVGSKKEYRFYSLKKVRELDVIKGNVAADILIIERLFSSRMFALVTVSDPWTLEIHHVMQDHVASFSYSKKICAVKLNASRLVVLLEDSLYIYSLPDMKEQHIIHYIYGNCWDLCILSQNIENNFLAYPGDSSKGKMLIFDASIMRSKDMIRAHKNRIAAMAFDPTGTKIATISKMGTAIRVFDVIEKTKLYEFRRNFTMGVQIYSLCFSQDSNYLSLSISEATLHIFRLNNPREEASAEKPEGLVSAFNMAMSSPTSILEEDDTFATVLLPFRFKKNISAMAMIEESLRVLVVSEDRILRIYNVDSVNGGQCGFENMHCLSETNGRGSGCSIVPQNNPLRSVCVRGSIQHQETPGERTPQ